MPFIFAIAFHRDANRAGPCLQLGEFLSFEMNNLPKNQSKCPNFDKLESNKYPRYAVYQKLCIRRLLFLTIFQAILLITLQSPSFSLDPFRLSMCQQII